MLLCVLGLAGSILAACSSSPPPSASQTVCNDRTQLSSAVSTVVDDVHAGNFGKAKDDLPAIRDAVNSLSESIQGLKSEESKALSPQIGHLKETADNLKSPSSLSDLQSTFNSFKEQLQTIGNQITQTLNCSS